MELGECQQSEAVQVGPLSVRALRRRAVPGAYQPLFACEVDAQRVLGFIPPGPAHLRVCDYLAPPVQNLDEGLHVPVVQ